MNILISYHTPCDIMSDEEISRFVEHVFKSENVSDNVEVSITFVDSSEIHDLNKQYRGIDRPTDVLSFECDGEIVEAGGNIAILGDIVICPEVLAKQAPEYGNSECEELELLLCHGCLHLLGYDHIEDDDAVVMQKREKEILHSWRKSW